MSTLDGNGPPTATKPNSLGSWAFTVIICFYCFFAWRGFERVIPIFDKLFAGMGVQLPFLTRILLANYSWLLLVLYGGAAILTIARQFLQLSQVQLRIANAILIFMGAVFPPLVIFAMYLPLFELIHKLATAH
jgi:type II secretory pathway component PulF